jgi:DNA-binding response OmpR family regulator
MADKKGKRILIIEDESDVAETEKLLLEREGYSVEIALGGAEGIKKMPVYKPDIILLDIMMPKVSGKDVLESMKRSKTKIPVIVVTAVGATKELRDELEAKYRIDGFVSKTYIRDLTKEVQSVLRVQGFTKD